MRDPTRIWLMVGTPFCFAPPAPPPTSAAETRAKAHKGRRRCALTMVAGTEGTTCAASGGSLVEAQLGAGGQVREQKERAEMGWWRVRVDNRNTNKTALTLTLCGSGSVRRSLPAASALKSRGADEWRRRRVWGKRYS